MAYREFQKKELGIGLNAFNRPVEYSGIESWVRLFVQLLFTIPGTYPTDPELGIGIQTYRYEFFDDIRTDLESKINYQKRTYLPDVPIGDVILSTDTYKGNMFIVLALKITASGYNTDTVWVAIDSAKKTLNYEISF